MIKVYVVTGKGGKYDEYRERVLYAGTEKKSAFSVKPDDYYDELELEVWLNDTVVEVYEKNEDNSWLLTYNKEKEVEREISELKKEIKLKEEMLNDIRKNII